MIEELNSVNLFDGGFLPSNVYKLEEEKVFGVSLLSFLYFYNGCFFFSISSSEMR